MVERIWLAIRKRVIHPLYVAVFLLLLLVTVLGWNTKRAMRLPCTLVLIFMVVYAVILVIRYRKSYQKVISKTRADVNYNELYKHVTQEVEWYLLSAESTEAVYVYPDWIKFFHVYFMELVEKHNYKGITDFTVMAALTKALVTKNDDILYIDAFITAHQTKMETPMVYEVKRGDKGTVSLERIEWKIYHSLDYIIMAFGFDCISKRVKELLKDDASLMEIEEFYEDLYACGINDTVNT